MLSVIYEVPQSFKKSMQCHLMDGKSSVNELTGIRLNEVIEIQADGDELEAIKDQFDGILYHKSARVQTFRGEEARFIFDHLIL